MVWEAAEFRIKARENLEIARTALDQGAPNAAASRAYYAAFHAAIAGLLEHSAIRPKEGWTHGFVQARLAQQLVNQKKVLVRQHASLLGKLIGHRHTADYGPGVVSKNIAAELFKSAKELVEKLASEPPAANGGAEQ
jgi:uncharacterized protein (UPF0332 family)